MPNSGGLSPLAPPLDTYLKETDVEKRVRTLRMATYIQFWNLRQYITKFQKNKTWHLNTKVQYEFYKITVIQFLFICSINLFADFLIVPSPLSSASLALDFWIGMWSCFLKVRLNSLYIIEFERNKAIYESMLPPRKKVFGFGF